MIAALYVEKNGAYYGLEGVDPWDEERDARLYAGPHPVVAHPPCARWCLLAGLVEARWGHKRGQDGGCFEAALRAVRTWGGVLEHPAYSAAWPAFGLARPRHGRWLQMRPREWVAQVWQRAYGHRARKATWLYVVSRTQPPELDWSKPAPLTWISWCANHGDSFVQDRMGKKESNATPERFRDLLISIALSCQ